MTTLYLVMMSIGTCCDQTFRTLAAFSSLAKANAYLTPKQDMLQRLHGKYEAHGLLMQEWEASHPQPNYDEQDLLPEVYEDWCTASQDAYKAFAKTLKIDEDVKAAGLDLADWETTYYYVKETTLDPEA